MSISRFTRNDRQILRRITRPVVATAPSVLYQESEVARLRQTGDRLKAAQVKKTSMIAQFLGMFDFIFNRKHKLLATRAEEIRARVRWMRSDLNSRLS